MPDQLQQALIDRHPQLQLLRGAKTIQAAPPGDIDPSEIMRGEIPVPNASVLDMFNPKNAEMMDQMYVETNPIFKKMEDTGMFKGANTDRGAAIGMRNMPQPEHIKWLAEMRAKIPTLEELGRQLPAWGKPAVPYQNVTRMPVQGGVLHDVLQRAAEKAGAGMGNTPGEARLLEHFMQLIR